MRQIKAALGQPFDVNVCSKGSILFLFLGTYKLILKDVNAIDNRIFKSLGVPFYDEVIPGDPDMDFDILVLMLRKQRHRYFNTCDPIIELWQFGKFLLDEVQKFLISIKLDGLYSNLHFYLHF